MHPVDAVAGAVPGAQDPEKPICDNCTLDNRMDKLFNDRRTLDAATAAGKVIW